jgi:hypothetical protein
VSFHEEALKALKAGVPLAKIRSMPVISKMLRSKFAITSDQIGKMDELIQEMMDQFKAVSGIQEAKVVE